MKKMPGVIFSRETRLAPGDDCFPKTQIFKIIHSGTLPWADFRVACPQFLGSTSSYLKIATVLGHIISELDVKGSMESQTLQ